MSGDDLTLDCTYTLSHEKINSIKYFLGGEEIYEYNPNKNPKYKTYIVNLGTNLWGNQSMTLRKVNGKYTGLYKCSILTDSIVDAEEDSGSVTVVDKPLEAPKIDVEENGFQVGKVLKANCTSIGGYPPANLTWLVNGEKVASNGISGPKQYVEDGEVDISVSELMLPIMIAPRSGHIKLTCTATQYTLYSVSTDLQVDLKEVTVSSSTKLMNMFLVPDRPVIESCRCLSLRVSLQRLRESSQVKGQSARLTVRMCDSSFVTFSRIHRYFVVWGNRAEIIKKAIRGRLLVPTIINQHSIQVSHVRHTQTSYLTAQTIQ
ncbi:hypothetical protein J6590_009651 [Homalodisca vitripennis]|nr:hypothetical protein J6590_009651 [Homalodisca vitripennis]